MVSITDGVSAPVTGTIALSGTAVSDAPSIDVRGAAVVAVGTQDQRVDTAQSSWETNPSVTALAGGGWVGQGLPREIAGLALHLGYCDHRGEAGPAEGALVGPALRRPNNKSVTVAFVR